MRITHLGHAGFCVETASATVIMDPWLSPYGAFDSAWFQFPRNHHMADFVNEKLADGTKERFVYVSHEHQDHFDLEFLRSLRHKDFTFVIPNFERAALRSLLANLGAKAVINCEHNRAVPIPGGYLKLYLDDSGINRDSGVLLKADGESFLNFNDCKLYDQLAAIGSEEGPISIFTCQFSGATWHPVCYDYSPDVYQRISRQKMLSKFEAVAKAIETVAPRMYLTSAGPACFLDPMLMHVNFEPVNIFPRAEKFLSYLQTRLANSSTLCLEITPGDTLNAHNGNWEAQGTEKVSEERFEAYMKAYAADYEQYFAARRRKFTHDQLTALTDRLRLELEDKLSHFTLHKRVGVPLYLKLQDETEQTLRVDFANKIVESSTEIPDRNYYSILMPAWQIERVLDRRLTWEQFALTFRMRLNREPDVYQTLIQGFLLMEPEDLEWFCERFINIETKQKRIVIEAGGTKYSINRYCPHQGGDLSQGWLTDGRLWTCPRHRWNFALDNGGKCTGSNASIEAVCLETELAA